MKNRWAPTGATIRTSLASTGSSPTTYGCAARAKPSFATPILANSLTQSFRFPSLIYVRLHVFFRAMPGIRAWARPIRRRSRNVRRRDIGEPMIQTTPQICRAAISSVATRPSKPKGAKLTRLAASSPRPSCVVSIFRWTHDTYNPATLQGGYFFGANSNIGAERGKTYTLGGVITPTFLRGLNRSVYWDKIDIRNAVGQIQPVDALTSCYITDPTPGNPLCAAVTRDPTTGYILNAFVDDRNLALIKQQGIDIDFRYGFDLDFGPPESRLTLGYTASIVTKYSIQRNAALTPVDCKGTYGAACSSDLVTLVAPDFRSRATITWDSKPLTVQFGWKRIGSVRDSTAGSTGRIPAYDYFDLNLAVRPPVEGLTLAFGIDNLFDKKPPLPVNPGAYNTFPDTYDVLGTTFGFSVTLRR